MCTEAITILVRESYDLEARKLRLQADLLDLKRDEADIHFMMCQATEQGDRMAIATAKQLEAEHQLRVAEVNVRLAALDVEFEDHRERTEALLEQELPADGLLSLIVGGLRRAGFLKDPSGSMSAGTLNDLMGPNGPHIAHLRFNLGGSADDSLSSKGAGGKMPWWYPHPEHPAEPIPTDR